MTGGSQLVVVADAVIVAGVVIGVVGVVDVVVVAGVVVGSQVGARV